LAVHTFGYSILFSSFSNNLTYYRYDFDRDGYITKEDVRLILSHIPIVNSVEGKLNAEGAFTREGGGM
jgi:hypothetical protein